MLKRLVRLSIVLAAAVLMLGCEVRPETNSGVLIRIVASDSAAQLVDDLTRSFSAKRPGVKFDITLHPFPDCQRMVAEGNVHLALAPFSASEVPVDMELTPVARDGIAVIVHPSNRVDSLTLLELRDLYFGNIGEWQDLGGAAARVQVLTRESECPVARQFEAVVLSGWKVTSAAMVLPNEEAVVDFVSGHSEAIGYVSAAFADDRVKTVTLEGMQPDPETVAAGVYHIALDLYALNRTPAAPEVTEFLQFIVSPAGQSVVSRHYGRLR